jgi:hypothetical protein
MRTTMTDASARRRGPLLTLSNIEWKLLLTAVLSAVYTYGFVAVARPTTPAPVTAVSTPMSVVSAAANVPSTRVAPSPTAPSTVASSTVPRAAQPRIRTRSS